MVLVTQPLTTFFWTSEQFCECTCIVFDSRREHNRREEKSRDDLGVPGNCMRETETKIGIDDDGDEVGIMRRRSSSGGMHLCITNRLRNSGEFSVCRLIGQLLQANIAQLTLS